MASCCTYNVHFCIKSWLFPFMLFVNSYKMWKKLWHLRQVEDVALACRERCAEPLVPGRPGQSHVLLCWIPSRDQQRTPPSFKRFWTQTTPRRWRDHWRHSLLIAQLSFIYVHNIDYIPQSRGELVLFGARGCIFLSSARRTVPTGACWSFSFSQHSLFYPVK